MSENYLIHFGNKNSGRYPRGSGENPHQHDGLKAAKQKYRNDIKELSKLNKSKPILLNNYDKIKKHADITKKISNKKADIINDYADIKEAKKAGGGEKFLRRQLYRTGAPGSAKDTAFGGQASKTAEVYANRYGEDALRSVLDKQGKRRMKVIGASAAVAIGSTVASMLMKARY